MVTFECIFDYDHPSDIRAKRVLALFGPGGDSAPALALLALSTPVVASLYLGRRYVVAMAWILSPSFIMFPVTFLLLWTFLERGGLPPDDMLGYVDYMSTASYSFFQALCSVFLTMLGLGASPTHIERGGSARR